MFIHNFKYTFKTLLKNKALIFWSFAFPIILGTLFNMAFSNISNKKKLDIIDIAIVNNEDFKNNTIYVDSFKTLSDKGNSNQLFNTKYVSINNAKKLLEDDKIEGYIIIKDNKPKLVFNKNGINQTIIKYVVEEIQSNEIIINNLSNIEIQNQIKNGNYNIDYNEISNKIINKINSDVNIIDKSNKNTDFMVIEFYTLIAMTCLYGGLICMTAINQNLANMSNKGKRIEAAPIKKSTVILSSLCSSYLIQLIGLLLLFIYTILVLKVDYGNNLLLIILLSLVGSLTGLSLGLSVGVLVKKGEGAKIGILLAITMIGSFLSGMMGVTLKYVIDKNIPILNKINPASMITDGFYSLYYYNTLNRYYLNIISLLIVSSILIIISVIKLRRNKYDSI